MKAILESITDNSYSINAYHYERSAFEAPWHFHPQCELVYILEGKGTRYVGNSIELFEEGDFVMIAGNVPHCWKNASDFKGNCHSIVVQWMENSIAVLPEYDTIAPVFWRAKQGLHILPSRSRKYKHLMNDITTLDPFARLLYFLTLLGELKNESEYKLLCDSEQEYKLSVSTNERLNKVYLYIENHFSEGLTLSDIAGEVNMGTESFSRFFSKAMNKSFFSYLNEYRIKRACKMLTETNNSVSDICYSCGFQSLAFFHKQFNKLKNSTPLQFRKKFLCAMDSL